MIFCQLFKPLDMAVTVQRNFKVNASHIINFRLHNLPFFKIVSGTIKCYVIFKNLEELMQNIFFSYLLDLYAPTGSIRRLK